MECPEGRVLTIADLANKPKNAKTMRRAPLTRAQLLPIALATARVFSLKNHLALVAMRNGAWQRRSRQRTHQNAVSDLSRLRQGLA
jgi:hypothetical protein